MTYTIAGALETARRKLRDQTDSSALDAQTLLSAALGRPRAWLLAHPEIELSDEQATRFAESLDRVLAGTALPHVLGEWEFFGRRFRLSPSVLIPRPETERMVELALQWVSRIGTSSRILDVGTGSGCIAVTLALELPGASVIASDVSREALEIARLNAEAHGVLAKIACVQADLLAALVGPFDLLCANLPYVTTEELKILPVREPLLALDGGPDGLSLISRLVSDLPRCLAPRGAALLEIDPRQAGRVVRMARAALPGSTVEVAQDLAGKDRVVLVRAGGSRAD
ncbi:MAG: peptide chain release factor N(5)-glutamine methyltransferase [Chloroflexota bacterium]